MWEPDISDTPSRGDRGGSSDSPACHRTPRQSTPASGWRSASPPARSGGEPAVRRTPARIHLRVEAHTVIAAETAKHLPMEAGGVLLGYREDANIVVTHALVVDGGTAS